MYYADNKISLVKCDGVAISTCTGINSDFEKSRSPALAAFRQTLDILPVFRVSYIEFLILPSDIAASFWEIIIVIFS